MSIEKLYQLFLTHPSVCIDSRKVKEGDLFFALKGDNFDGNAFAQTAVNQGAAYAIVDNPNIEPNDKYIIVNDTLKTLQQLANHHRKQFEIPIIAITGSNGKTTTKELVSAVLSSHYPTHFTQGNLNNHIGVPLTLLSIPSKTEVAVIEMGANHIGEIDFLCNIAEPTHGLITNVGEAHLEGFGSFEGVRIAKGELYRFLEKNRGLAFINLDEPYLREMAGDNLFQVHYRQSDNPDPNEPIFEAILVSANPFVKLAFYQESGKKTIVKSQLIGNYNFNNIMTAITIGRYFKVPEKKIKTAIENYVPSNNRSQLIEIGDNQFLMDAYNANPTSMTRALESFARYKAKRKIAIIGDMLELGEFSKTAHAKILQHAKDLNLAVITVGKSFYQAEGKRLDKFEDVSALKDWFYKQSFHKVFFLLKGSRGMKLETILK